MTYAGWEHKAAVAIGRSVVVLYQFVILSQNDDSTIAVEFAKIACTIGLIGGFSFYFYAARPDL